MSYKCRHRPNASTRRRAGRDADGTFLDVQVLKRIHRLSDRRSTNDLPRLFRAAWLRGNLRLEKDRHLYKEFNALDEALNWARHINEHGRVALLIEGDDGTRLTKQQIVANLTSPR